MKTNKSTMFTKFKKIPATSGFVFKVLFLIVTFGTISISVFSQNDISWRAEANTPDGAYASIGGIASGNSIINSNTIVAGTTQYFVMATTCPDITPIATTACNGVTFMVTPVDGTNGAVPSGTTYTWPEPTGSGFSGGEASTGPATSISGTLGNTTTEAVTATYTVTPTDGTCTGSPFTVIVTVVNVVVDQVYAMVNSNTISGVCPNTPFDLHSNTNLPGFPQPAVLLTEDFETGTDGSTTPPTGWTASMIPIGSVAPPRYTQWRCRHSPYAEQSTYFTPPFFPVTISSNTGDNFFISENPSGGDYESSLISPAFSTIGYNTLTLDFWDHYRDVGPGGSNENDDYAYIEWSTDDFATSHIIISTFDETHGYPYDFAHETVNLSGAIGNASVKFRFRYHATYDYYWAVDNIKVTGTSPIQGFSWTASPAAAGFPNTVNVSPTGITQNGTTTYTAHYQDLASGCPAGNASVTVISYPAAAKPTIDIIDPLPPTPLSFCTSGSVTLKSSVSPWYIWNQYGSPIPTEIGQTLNRTITVLPPPTPPPTLNTNISVTIKDANGCYATSDTVHITVIPLPSAAGTITGTSTVCQGATGVIYIVPAIANATGYVWTKPAGANIDSQTYDKKTNTWSITVSYNATAVSGNISVYGTNSCGNGTVSPNFAVTVTTTATVTPGGPDAVCQSATPSAITLSGASVGGGATTGAWSITAGSGILSNPAQTASPATVTFTPAANYTGIVTLTLTTNAPGACPVVSASRTITVNSLPTTPTISAGGPTTFCAGGSVTLTSSAGTSYLWSNAATTASITINASGNYTVQVTNADGCHSAASAATVVTVNALPTTSAIYHQ